jgi:GNAT superfamily N-acetyltransferase
MSLCVIKNIKPEKSKKLVDVVYENFKHLSPYKELMHDKNELSRLITNSHSHIWFIMADKRIAAYLIGELKDLNDGRRVFYISYIYTASNHRRQGLASKLIAYAEALCKKFKYDGILLTTDIEDEDVYNFYQMRGFMPDLMLRRYNKFDVLYKSVFS